MAKPKWDHRDFDDLTRLRDRKLRRQVRFQLYAYSPFYRNSFEQAGLKAEGFIGVVDLAKLPLVDRACLARAPADFLLQPSKSLMQRWSSAGQLSALVMDKLLRGLDYADAAINNQYAEILFFETAGTTSDPITVGSSRRDLSTSATQGQRMLEVAGLSSDDVILNLLEYRGGYAFWVTWGGAVALGARQVLPGFREMKDLAKMARDQGVSAVVAEPEDALRFMQSAPDLSQLRTVILGPQPLAPALRSRLAQIVSEEVKIVCTYGFAEARAAWAECREGAGKPDVGYHSQPDLQIFESISPTGEIAFTSLEQRGTALARYLPGDVAAGGIVLGPCPYCHRIVERMVGPVRRAANLLRLQLAGGAPLAVDVEELVSVLAHPAVLRWQVEVTKTEGDPHGADELFVLYKPRANADPARVAIELNKSFRQELGICATQFVVSDRAAGGVVDLRPLLVEAASAGTPASDKDAPLVRLWRTPGA